MEEESDRQVVSPATEVEEGTIATAMSGDNTQFSGNNEFGIPSLNEVPHMTVKDDSEKDSFVKSSSSLLDKSDSEVLRDYYGSKMDETMSTVWTESKMETIEGSVLESKESVRFKYGRHDASTIPFALHRSFGMSVKPRFLNLTMSPKVNLIFYAVTHVGVLFNYKTREQKFLLGHKNTVENISADSSGKWLVTADKGKDNTVIVWNGEECVPINTIFDAHGAYGVDKVIISHDAKYLLTVGNEPKPIIKLWLWTQGKEEADGQQAIKGNFGEIKDLINNINCSEHFMLTFENQVIFITWENNILITKPGTIQHKKNIGKYTSSAYLMCSTCCATATDCGWVILWGNPVYRTPYKAEYISNDKVFLKAIKLQTHTITRLTTVNRLYVTGDVLGHIKFYDRKMRILYWCHGFDIGPIVDICFHRYMRKYCYEDIDNSTYTPERRRVETTQSMSLYEDRSKEYERLVEALVPTDATLRRTPFVVRDFILLTSDSQLGYVNFIADKYEVIIKRTEKHITSMDVHNEGPILCVGHENGRLMSYNYVEHEFLLDVLVPCTNNEQDNQITAIRFSHHDAHLAVGTSNGNFWFLHPVILEPKGPEPFRFDSEAILGIRFSQMNEYCAYYDANMGVCLFIFDMDSPVEWKYVGRVIAHYRPIVELIFIYYEEVTRLLTVGEDRYLVEYDITKSEEGVIGIKSCTHVEQTAIPQSLIYFRTFEGSYFFMSDNKYKFKLLADNTFVCLKTILAPTFDEPIQKMMMVSKNQQEQSRYMLFSTEKFLGIHYMPADGNPYRYVGMITHPKELIDFAMSADCEYAFTIGKEDNCCLMWHIKLCAADNMVYKGGRELEPYYCLIEGGIDGWLFKEMQDLFYYMQILNQGENSPHPRNITNKIELTELANLMQSIGFYPTEYELVNLMKEAQTDHYNERHKVHEITFEEFVKLYINHRPAFGVSADALKNAFLTLAPTGVIEKNDFREFMCNRGELFTPEDLRHCFSILMHFDEDDDNKLGEDTTSRLIPPFISYDVFVNDMLGIDMEKTVAVGDNNDTVPD